MCITANAAQFLGAAFFVWEANGKPLASGWLAQCEAPFGAAILGRREASGASGSAEASAMATLSLDSQVVPNQLPAHHENFPR